MKVLRLHKPLILFLLGILGTGACNTTNESSTFNNERSNLEFSDEWIISKEEVLDGGPGVDGIPSIDKPQFNDAANISYVDDDRLVVGIRLGNTVKAYPHEVLDYHEIVNDGIDSVRFALTYCPLTGTAIGWERNTEFGVSGLIFRNNLIPYDRSTGSRYSQMQMRAVNGPLSGVKVAVIPVIQTTWKTWKSMYPQSQVLTTDTGFDRNYDEDLYGERYREEDSATIFPIKNRDDRLPAKKRVHGVIEGNLANEESEVRAYVIDEFGTGVNIINDDFADRKIVIIGSTDKDFAVSFFNTLDDGTELNPEAVQNSLPIVMKDKEGNRWDLFGYAVEGPRKGERLTPTLSYTGYWFAWADFFPRIEIYRFN